MIPEAKTISPCLRLPNGVARISQMQLLQPFLTFMDSALLLGEEVTPRLLAVALTVVATVAVARRAPVQRRLQIP